jgi:mono/diheme cytochrome c family protein
LYQRFCASCHSDGAFGSWDPFFKRFMPAIRGPGLRSVADKQYLRDAIDKGRPGTLMPAWGKSAGGLTDEQIAHLVGHLFEGDKRPLMAKLPLPDLRSGEAKRGGQLFGQLCAGCHGENKLAPTLGNPVFQNSASDEFIVRTIMSGRPDTAMPAFRREGAAGLTDSEISDLVAYLRSLRRASNVDKGVKP